MKTLLFVSLLLVSSISIAAKDGKKGELWDGKYTCGGGEILELRYLGKEFYRASFVLEDGSVSVLDVISFEPNTGKGVMLPDDEGTLGTAQMNGGYGFSLTLTFDDGYQINCLHKFAYIVRD